ncbi:hypothetical protein [Streptococcus mutans]|jgi:membrane protein|uniref:hypothetical protein n=1 Tax=Streptococcus mutans TaxID=1309 RepID=UPI000466FC78|nr:hypothetical protein [Streptococcus mutans]
MIFEDFKRKLKEQIIRQNQKKDAMVFDRFNLAIDKYVKNFTAHIWVKKEEWQRSIIYDILSLIIILNFFLLFVDLLIILFNDKTNIIPENYKSDFSFCIAAPLAVISVIKMLEIAEMIFKAFVKSWLIFVIILIIEIIILDINNLPLLYLFLVILLMLVSTIHIGSKKYFEFVCYLKYCEEVIRGNKFVNWQKITVAIALLYFLVIALSNFEGMPLEWGLFVIFSLLYLIYVRTLTPLVKISFNFITYSLYLILLFVNRENYSFFNNFDPMQFSLFSFSVIFSLERITKSVDELIKFVEDESILLYLERIYDKRELAKRKITSLQLLKGYDIIDEKELVQQILLRFNFSIYEEFQDLYQIYIENKFTNYKVLVYSLQYEILINNSENNKTEMINLLSNIYEILYKSKLNQKIDYQDYKYDLSVYIYFVKCNYNQVLEIFDSSIISKDEDFIYLAYCSAKELGEDTKASELKKMLPVDMSELSQRLKNLSIIFNIEEKIDGDS